MCVSVNPCTCNEDFSWWLCLFRCNSSCLDCLFWHAHCLLWYKHSCSWCCLVNQIREQNQVKNLSLFGILFYFPQWYFKSRLILFQINFIFTEFTACHPPQLRECIAAKIKSLRMERKRGELVQLSDVGYHISLFIFSSTPLCWPESLPPLVKLVKAWTSLSP